MQIFYEDVKVGAEISHVVRVQLGTRDLVKWAGAVEDWAEIHYDKDYAKAMGLPDVIVHGPYKGALLVRLMTEWIGELGKLKKFSCHYHALNVPGETLTCKGRIVNKVVKGAENLIECEIRMENQAGVISTIGKATASIPSRNSKP